MSECLERTAGDESTSAPNPNEVFCAGLWIWGQLPRDLQCLVGAATLQCGSSQSGGRGGGSCFDVGRGGGRGTKCPVACQLNAAEVGKGAGEEEWEDMDDDEEEEASWESDGEECTAAQARRACRLLRGCVDGAATGLRAVVPCDSLQGDTTPINLHLYRFPKLQRLSVQLPGHKRSGGLHLKDLPQGLTQLRVASAYPSMSCQHTFYASTPEPMRALRVLTLKGVNLPQGFDVSLFPTLQRLSIVGCRGPSQVICSAAHNLKHLNLSNTNSIETLDITPCQQLTHVYVSNTRIRRMGLALPGGAPRLALTHLNVSTCFTLEDLDDLVFTPNLTHLDCSCATSIPNLDLSCTPKLVYLDCQYVGALQHLDLRHVPCLQHLDISQTLVPQLDVSACPQLHTLVANRCKQLRSLSLTNCLELRSLELCESAVTSLQLPTAGALYLNRLIMATTNLPAPDLSLLPSLQYLDVSNCPAITFLDCSGCHKLISLHSSNCQQLVWLM